MASKDPAFLFYTSDFLTGTMLMTDKQVGQYIRLLCLQHQKGRLAEKDIKKLCGGDEDIMEKFIQDENGFYYNKRLEEEANKRDRFIQHQRENGSKGGRPSSKKDIPNKTQTKPNENPRDNFGLTQKEPKQKPLENENENENENINTIKNIINYLNKVTDSNYRYQSKSTQEHIRARFKEGRTFEDFKAVIDKKQKDWANTDMAKFLRPETLFGNKFEGYLNQKVAEHPANNNGNRKREVSNDLQKMQAEIERANR